ncbi:P-loop containing nucleoside triphosphate hydrolase protein [Zychaea mexicana]|uniref:P-loop containing nucleoside triphosphate hydrolase protein n=1 Tax=Zychaea mexicana TaxID=64656 RepID=UPI0022FDD36A|nr:P-loop containing nucleoside triphosphate hydrolase protein [Zychaea mexicana]KAI9493149.1 P-loop containing nucleoside triphosphate hydrolase protein [Zychaea mexicana]
MPVSTTTTTTTTTTALPLKTSSLPKPSSRHHIDTTNGKKSIAGQQEQQKERQEQQQEHTVHVALRVRPTENANDTFKTRGKVITIAPFQKSFAFDHVFESQSTQEQVFRGTTKDLIGQVINGRNATLLAYGERATGKSYTLGCTLNSYEDPAYEGIIPRAAAALFDRLQRPGQTLRPASTFTTSSSSSSSSLRSPNPTQSTSASARLRPVSMVGPPRRGSSPNLTNGTNGPRYAVRISFAEVHDDKLVDLLCSSADSNKLPFDRSVRNAQQSVHGIKEVAVRNTGDILRFLSNTISWKKNRA